MRSVSCPLSVCVADINDLSMIRRNLKMSLPQPAIDFLNQNARANGLEQPGAADDLFQSGALDSFALVDFVNVLESTSGIKVPDADVNAENFRTIEAIEAYVAAQRG
jgi:acyl carrier protein